MISPLRNRICESIPSISSRGQLWGWLLCLPLLLISSAGVSGCTDIPDDDNSSPTPTLEPYTRPIISTSPERLDFGEVVIGTSKSLPLDIVNSGQADLFVETVEISAGVVFGVPNAPAGFTIVPNAKVTVDVVFSPTEAVETGGSLRIISNDEVNDPITVALIGTGSRGTDDDGDDVTVEEGDCDDNDDTVNPNAPEICDGQDNDCDNEIDEDSDLDQDGYTTCGEPAEDCDDSNADVHPGTEEQCDGLDNDCNGVIDDGYDVDGDGSSDCVDDDEDGVSEEQGDCDDANGDVGPGEVDVCDGLDNDCDGTADNGTDTDQDGTSDCTDDDDDQYSEEAGDCNDAEPSQYPGSPEQCNGVDEDCDGVIDNGVDADADQDGYSICKGDCDDYDANIHPGGTETCNGKDDDCNGTADDGLPTSSWYADGDADGYGDPSIRKVSCGQPAEYVADNTDCNDAEFSVHPGAPESCNGIDDDCDGQVDDGVTLLHFYQDSDADGYGNANMVLDGCVAPTGYVADSSDCDDTLASIHPGATEQCNNLDDDCDAQVDEGVATGTWYRDADKDGFGASNQTITSCARPDGFVSTNTDCDDSKATVYPGAPEQCNSIDDDCDGVVDDGTVDSTWYRDADQDGFGNASSTRLACSQPSGYVLDSRDCDDTRASVYPGAPEACNQVDDDCDGQVDEGVQKSYYPDVDKDSFGAAGSQPVMACAAPSGYVATNSDCDDTKASVYPGATEQCNGIDDDCDTSIDEGIPTTTYYADSDGDGYGNPGRPNASCKLPTGYVSDNTDCDDTRNTVYPGAPEVCNGIDEDCDQQIDEGVKSNFYVDGDKDSYGKSGSTPTQACTAPANYVANSSDCDDTNALIYPGATELCNSKDDDCDGQVDEGAPTSAWYRDADGDGYGTSASVQQSCAKPTGYVSNSTDCDDTKASVYPGALEQCNSIDDDCDGVIDDGVVSTPWYKDGDGDGYGNASNSQQACSQPSGFVANGSDCDDTKASVYPGANESCNGVDDDCDGSIDENVKTNFYVDGDKDGYGKAGSSPTAACTAPTGYVSNSLDCDDTRNSAYPGATEQCNGLDDDCDSLVDDGVSVTTWYADTDNDGYGNSSVSTTACAKPTGYVYDRTDCDDTKSSVNPGAAEACNAIDDNCNAQVDEGVKTSFYVDGDADGYGRSGSTPTSACTAPSGYVANSTDCNDTNAAIHPNATEACNGLDDDCDALVDENLTATQWYQDSDNDGYGNSSVSQSACQKPTGYVSNSTDCNDTKPTINPGAAETCNGIDDDCDSVIDDGVKTNFYVDGDSDGYGKSGSTATAACTAPSGYVANSSDCDDTKSSVYPGAVEQCNLIDDDCDAVVDDGVTSSTWYKDGDGDTYGANANSQVSCSQPSGFVSRGGDCDDAKASVNPGATETCNAVDDDCDGVIDDGVKTTYTVDGDGDGYGKTGGTTTQACTQPSGYAANAQDCDDTNAAIKPGATEVCDGKDQDCDGQIDEGFSSCSDSDDDNDGYTENQGDCNDANSSVYPMTVDASYVGTETGTKTQPFNTVQEGITAVTTTCPLVLVKPGTYLERIDFKGKAITVRSTTQYAAILDGQSGGSVVTFKTAETSAATLDGFTIQNGSGTNGGGVYSLNASPTIINNLFKLHTTTNGGAGLYAKGGSLSVKNNTFQDNVGASVASGAFAGGALMLDTATAVISNNTFQRNRHVAGGAIGMKNATGTIISNNLFSQNAASDVAGAGVGGAIYILNTTLSLDGNLFSANTASDAAGAVYIYGQDVQANTTVSFSENIFDSNTSGNMASTTDDGLAGAVFLTFAVADFTLDEFISNASSALGGAIYVKNSSTATFDSVYFDGNSVKNTTASAGGAIYISASTVTVDSCELVNNNSAYNAGALTALSATGLQIINTLFTGNLATASTNGKGGAIYLDRVVGELHGSTFTGNQAGFGGGALILQDSQLSTYQNSFVSNVAGTRAGALWITSNVGSTNSSMISNNLFLGNSVTSGAGGAIYFNAKSASGYLARGSAINNVLSENAATTNGAGIYIGTDAPVTVMNNVIQTSKTREGIYASTSSVTLPVTQYNVTYQNAVAGYGGKTGVWDSTNFEVDPKFTTYSNDGNFSNDNFHLQSSSTLKNAGNPSSSYNDADTTRNDIGAYGGPLGAW